MALLYDQLRKQVDKRIWYKAGGVFAFLVDTPHTFGHSQLVLKTSKSDKEERIFARTSLHAAICVGLLRRKLPYHRGAWGKLARYTITSGRYKKTLILRVSAEEGPDTYKLHLVPYFSSHYDATCKLFQATHNEDESKTGGLLHWLGNREVLIDYDMREGRDHPIVKNRIASFKLPELALVLSR